MIATGVSTFGGGLERYTFRLSSSYVIAAFERAAGSEPVINAYWASCYLLSPRPDARDILSAEVHLGPSEALVTLVIKRGHYLLLDLMLGHEDVLLKSDGSVRCSCHDETRWILRNTLPEYKELHNVDASH